jgi:hypothetical protein
MSDIAVIVRGQARTWKYIAKHNIQVINNSYNNPDWFFSLAEGNLTKEDIQTDFLGSELISVQFFKDQDYVLYSQNIDAIKWRKFPLAYFRMAYFEYHAGLSKREHELATGKRYKAVFVIRPDCYFFPSDFKNVLSQIKSQDLVGFMMDPNTDEDFSSSDFAFLAGHRAANLMNMRYLDSRYTDGLLHQAVHRGDLNSPAYYMAKNLISCPNSKKLNLCLNQTIVRPNQISLLPITPAISHNQEGEYIKARIAWEDLPAQDKIEWCYQKHIDPRDYFLLRS